MAARGRCIALVGGLGLRNEGGKQECGDDGKFHGFTLLKVAVPCSTRRYGIVGEVLELDSQLVRCQRDLRGYS